MTAPLFSIVIPGFNRVEPLKYTLRSAADAAARLPAGSVEILLVDDGSSPPLAGQLAGFDPGHPVTHLRQPNQGSIVARQTGLAAARGERVLFLDSDDLVHPDKLVLHRDAALRSDADIVYDDMIEAALGPGYSATYFPGRARALARAASAPELLFHVQPAPHSPVYRRDYLLRALASPLVQPERRMDPAGDVWLYYNLAVHPARVAKLDERLTAVGPHEELRYSRHWEKLGFAALFVAEAFVRACPADASTLEARRAAGEIAFLSWRRLPHDYAPAYRRRLLAVWQALPRGPLDRLGGRGFVLFSRLVGPVAAGALHRRIFGRPYAASRTLDSAALALLFLNSGL